MKFTASTDISEVPIRQRGAFRRWKNRIDKPIENLFWVKVDIREKSQCWPYRAAVRRGVYGTFLVPGNNPKQYRAHRLAWILSNGHIPDGLCVCHKCDYPPCCNPDHLFLGTKKENSDDMIQKKRKFIPIGDLSPTAKLSAQEVIEIRKTYDPNIMTYSILAKRFGVSEQTIREAVTGVTWKTLPKIAKPTGVFLKGERHGSSKLKEHDVIDILKLFKSGVRQCDIARQFGVTQQCINRIRNGKSWGHLNLSSGMRGQSIL